MRQFFSQFLCVFPLLQGAEHQLWEPGTEFGVQERLLYLGSRPRQENLLYQSGRDLGAIWKWAGDDLPPILSPSEGQALRQFIKPAPLLIQPSHKRANIRPLALHFLFAPGRLVPECFELPL